MMKKWHLLLALLFVWSTQMFSQPLDLKASFNLATMNYTGPDSTKPYLNDKGARSVWYAGDLDGDGKKEVVATDYTQGGRVHLFEFSFTGTLELVWSSPTRPGFYNSGSTPRWVRTGDMDGDGMKEIIFPLSNGTADFQIQIWEYTGTNNNFGTEPAFTLATDYFVAQTVGKFRTNREVASVYDFDGDGSTELIMSNRDHSVYILGVFGTFPGFASWTLEGGDPAVVPINSKTFVAGSHWHSVPADINGDGKKEIINHHWMSWGTWGILARGADSYSYPDTSIDNFYYQYTLGTPGDAVAYMGVQPVDVDGDGNDEIAGILYIGASPDDYALTLLNWNTTDTGLYVFDSTKFGMLGHANTLSGLPASSFWGIGAADLNGNGKTEILLGGGNGFNVVAVEYKGTGSVLDSNSYTHTVVYEGKKPYDWGFYNIYDSLGVIDTVEVESPFISKMSAPFDSDNDGALEFAASYQSVYDSVTIKNYSYIADSSKFVLTATTKQKNMNQLTVRVLEATLTGLKEKQITFVTPDDYKLEQNYPNPFNPSTSIRFSLPLEKQISITIYDVLGNKVKTLIDNEVRAKGSYELTWDGTSSSGAKVASGTYVAEMKFGNFAKSVKMSLLK